MGVAATMLGNAITIICFTILSIHFENPWLILMAMLFYRSYTVETQTTNNKEKKEENNG